MQLPPDSDDFELEDGDIVIEISDNSLPIEIDESKRYVIA